MHRLGAIRYLARFPVKSMKGEALQTTSLTLQGVPEDRRYAFVQTASRSSFPWLTARELPEMLTYRARIEGTESPQVTVEAPSGEQWPVDSDELRHQLETQSGRALFLLRDHRGCYDAAPISLISQQTVARIAEESETREDPWRFRPNLLVDLEDGGPFDELHWVGRILRVGDSARVAITEVDKRCAIITLDPKSARPSPNILRCVAQQHQQTAGVYAVVLTEGQVHLGDPVSLEV